MYLLGRQCSQPVHWTSGVFLAHIRCMTAGLSRSARIIQTRLCDSYGIGQARIYLDFEMAQSILLQIRMRSRDWVRLTGVCLVFNTKHSPVTA